MRSSSPVDSYLAEHIFPEIDETPFAVLYSDRPSRHNTPVNVIIGALILKEIFGLTDEEVDQYDMEGPI